jgi:DNA-directed RNA polymerase II subunit RPB1
MSDEANAMPAPSTMRIRDGAVGVPAAHEMDDRGAGGERSRREVVHAASSLSAPSGSSIPSTRRRAFLSGSSLHRSKVGMASRLKSMTLSLLQEDEILRGSVVQVFNPDKPYSSGPDHFPIPHAMNDTRMGVIEHGLVCGTCGGDASSCPGHFGHIVLNVAIFSPAFMKLALQVLRSVCWTCALALRPEMEPPEESVLEKMYGPKDIARLAWISKHRPPHACPHCGMPQPKYAKVSATRVLWSWQAKRVEAIGFIPPDIVYEMRKPFTAARARMIFEAIPDATLAWLGLNAETSHPKAYVVRVLPVPPPCVRPSVVKIEGSKMRGQDDLTSILMINAKRVNQVRLMTHEDRISVPRLYDGGLVFDDCSLADMKRTIKPPSKVSRREEMRLHKERAEREEAFAPLEEPLAGIPVEPAYERAGGEAAVATAAAAGTPAAPLPADGTPSLRSESSLSLPADGSLPIEGCSCLPKLRGPLPPLLPHSSRALSLRIVTSVFDQLSMAFDEGRVDASIALTRPHTTAAMARLSARPDLRHCEVLQAKNPRLLTTLELYLMVHLSTDGKDTSIMRQRSGAQKKTLYFRFKGKEGRIRGNLMGKRVFSSGRAVISPCQQLDVDELGVPEAMACVLTVGKVPVNDATVERLRKCVRIGALRVNGAKMVVKGRDGSRIYLEYAVDRERIAQDLEPGDLVERYIQDGDLLIFNRQPSLHRMSMMAHRVRIMPSSTLRFNAAAAKPYNADFDGDEMNVHVPKGIRAQAEAESLMLITANLISPASNALACGIVQDPIVAVRMFTRPGMRLTRAKIDQLLAVVRYGWRKRRDTESRYAPLPEPAEVAPDGTPLWSGAQVLSLLLPRWLEVGSPASGKPHVSRGELVVPGARESRDGIGKELMGGSSNGITHRICVDGTLQMGMRFMSDAQRMLHAWMAEAGFTTGLHDMVLAQHIRRRIRFILGDLLDVVDAASSALFDVTRDATRFIRNEAEQRARKLVSSLVEEATQLGLGYMANEHDSGGALTRNGLWDMITSGSKGSPANAFQMAVAVGTQIITGQRIPLDQHTGRTLSCFPHGTNTAASRGLVTRSYVDGLQPQEFFFHNMGGREGLVRTAIMTAETGYLQRRLVKVLEDLIGMADSSVRDAELRVVQYKYGGDGLDPVRLQRCPADRMLVIPAEELAEKEGLAFATLFRKIRALFRNVYQVRPAKPELLLPCDPSRVLRGAMMDAKPAEIWPRIVFGDMAAVPGDTNPSEQLPDRSQQLRERATEYLAARHLGLAMAFLWAVRPSRNVPAHKIVDVASVCAAHHERARMAAGETCGIIAGQSIGEPSTQMTLNSPHHSGRVGSRVTMGVPRLKEIIGRKKEGEISTPLMILPVVADTREAAERVVRMVRRVRLRDVLHSSFVASDPAMPEPHPLSNIDKDCPWLEDLVDSHGGKREAVICPPGWKASPYVVRFSLRRENMIELGIAPVTLARAIDKAVQQLKKKKRPKGRKGAGLVADAGASSDVTAIVLYTPRASKGWVIRVRMLVHDAHPPPATDADWYHETQQLHVHILRRACANQAHSVDWATAGKAEFSELDPKTDTIVTRDRWVVQASGSSLASMSRIKELDWTRAHVNDTTMTASVLGLEAANALIYDQLLSIMTNDGSYIDPRHLQLLADGITYYGYIMPVRRHGVLRKKTGWALRASFEEMVTVLTVGAAKGEKEDLATPAGAVMTGQMGAFGAGWVGLHDDPEVARRYAELESRSLAAQINPTAIAEEERVATGGSSVAEYIDGHTGQLQARPVRILRELHDRRRLERILATRQPRQGGFASAGAAPSASPATLAPASPVIPLVASAHRYTVQGAIAASTYEGYGLDYAADSLPTRKAVVVGQNAVLGKRPERKDLVPAASLGGASSPAGSFAPAAPAAPHARFSLLGLEATILTRTGTLKVVQPIKKA